MHKPSARPYKTPIKLNSQQQALLNQLQSQGVMRVDFFRLRSQIYKLKDSNNNNLSDLELAILQAQERYAKRLNPVIELNFPENLPVSQKRSTIEELLQRNQVLVVAGETGSGKTTQLPKMCLELGLGRNGIIGHTQPRRIAARSVATRIAEELKTPMGEVVGYKVRFRDEVSDNTQIKLMTDGILLNEMQRDPYLNQYSVLIIDEAHERSLNNDFILGFLKTLLPKRPDLKLIITSATIDVQRFSQHFDNAPIVEVSGRTYPVEVLYRPLVDSEQDQAEAILSAIEELQQFGRGDILVFLSGEREIRDIAEFLNKTKATVNCLRHSEILQLYSRLSAQEQNRVFHPSSLNRIVLATNVAETSLTVPGIKYVIDTGLARISRYSHRTKVQRLPIEPISQASANQRMGRCGRVSNGVCIRLYSQEDFNNRPEFTDPEILRTNLASVVLQMTALGIRDIENFPFVDAPDKRYIQDGVRLLEELEAIKYDHNQAPKLTKTGEQLAQLPVDPRLAKMLLMAVKQGCLQEIMIIVSALSIQDPRERPQEKQQASDEKHNRFKDKKSDFLSLLNLWNYVQEQQKTLTRNQFRKLCQQDYLNFLRIKEWQDIYQQICFSVREMGLSINSVPAEYPQIHIALLAGLLSHIGEKLSDKPQYLGARNTHFSIFPNSALFKKMPKWCVAGELVETSRLWGRMVAEINPEWIEPLALHLVKKSYAEPRWSKTQGAVVAQEKVSLYGIAIVKDRRVQYGKIDPVLSREIFIRSALVEGNWTGNYAFFKQNLRLIEEVEELEHKTRRRDILVDDETLFNFYNERLPAEIVSQAHFDKWWKSVVKTSPDLLNFEKEFLTQKDTQLSSQDFPDYWYQGNLRLALSYNFNPSSVDDGVSVTIPLPLLNQVQNQGFDWLIPALQEELVINLIKALPKNLRKNFVPAPNYAQAFLARQLDQTQPLTASLSKELFKMTGVKIDPSLWDEVELPKHLRMNFQIVDQHHKLIQQSRNLDQLKFNLQNKVQQRLTQIVARQTSLEQSNLQTWSFGEIPQEYEQKQGGFKLKAYPALVDEKNSVAIKLFDNTYAQQQAMEQGLRRLILINVPSPIKYLQENLPNKAKLGLYFDPFGKVMDLIDDCISCAVDKLIADFGGVVWQEADFNCLQEFVRANLNDTTCEIAKSVEESLTLSFEINKCLKGSVDITTALNFADIKQQLSQLIQPNFVTSLGYNRLKDLQRYLLAIQKRIEKLLQDPNRDRLAMFKVESVQQAYTALLNKQPKSQPLPQAIKNIRYMIEELRVNLFAQQLGTPYPVSDKRILKVIEELK